MNIQTPDNLIRGEVTLSGTDGNAMMLIGACRRALRDAGNDDSVLSAFSTEATNGDYDHVLATCIAYCEVS